MQIDGLVLVVLAGIANSTVPESEDSSGKQRSGHAVAEAEGFEARNFYQCTSVCPAGYHVASSDNCSASCPRSCPNEVLCEENAGPSFYQCASGWAGVYFCPSGYHVGSNQDSQACSALGNNAMRCDRNEGESFTQCSKGWGAQLVCPAGYHVSSTEGCIANCAGTCPNIVTCAKN